MPYLGDELEEGVGGEGANRQSYEVEQQPLVKGLLHEGHHAGPREGAEGNDGHAEETIPPHCRWGRASPTQNGEKGECPMARQPPSRGKKVEGVGMQQGRFGWILTKATNRKKSETSREGERNRNFC